MGCLESRASSVGMPNIWGWCLGLVEFLDVQKQFQGNIPGVWTCFESKDLTTLWNCVFSLGAFFFCVYAIVFFVIYFCQIIFCWYSWNIFFFLIKSALGFSLASFLCSVELRLARAKYLLGQQRPFTSPWRTNFLNKSRRSRYVRQSCWYGCFQK